MKLTSWTATASGRAIFIEGTDEEGFHVELTDVVDIKNDVRAARTIAKRRNGEEVILS